MSWKVNFYKTVSTPHSPHYNYRCTCFCSPGWPGHSWKFWENSPGMVTASTVWQPQLLSFSFKSASVWKPPPPFPIPWSTGVPPTFWGLFWEVTWECKWYLIRSESSMNVSSFDYLSLLPLILLLPWLQACYYLSNLHVTGTWLGFVARCHAPGRQASSPNHLSDASSQVCSLQSLPSPQALHEKLCHQWWR
jgi:hypothetical protein